MIPDENAFERSQEVEHLRKTVDQFDELVRLTIEDGTTIDANYDEEGRQRFAKLVDEIEARRAFVRIMDDDQADEPEDSGEGRS